MRTPEPVTPFSRPASLMVLSATDTLRDALAALPQVARQWASAEFDATAGDSLTLFLVALTELARRAVVDSNRLYCCIS